MWKDEVPNGMGMTAWNPFPKDTTYFRDGNQAKRQNESYGRFVRIKDGDGNRVALWGPLESE